MSPRPRNAIEETKLHSLASPSCATSCCMKWGELRFLFHQVIVRVCHSNTRRPCASAWHSVRTREVFAGIVILFITQASFQAVGPWR